MGRERPQDGARHVKAVVPGTGDTGLLLPGVDVMFKIDGRDADGALSIEERFDVGALVPPHLHTREDEFSIVLEGEIGFRSGDQEVVLGSGGHIVKPRNEVHAMWNAGTTPARMIEVISPAGFEQYFRELAEKNAADPVGLDEVGELDRRYGLPDVEDIDWLADVIARYALSPPPGT